MKGQKSRREPRNRRRKKCWYYVHRGKTLTYTQRSRPITFDTLIDHKAEGGAEEEESVREGEAAVEGIAGAIEEFRMPPEMLQRRVSARTNKNVPPLRLTYKATTQYVKELKCWSELEEMSPREQKLWRLAAEDEMRSLTDHQVWELVDLPTGRHAITCKWVFKGKLDGEGNLDSRKARLVARGFSPKFGEDFDETFAPVAKKRTQCECFSRWQHRRN